MAHSNETNIWKAEKHELFHSLDSSERGLSNEDATARLAEKGPNEIGKATRRHVLEMLFSQFSNALIIILVIAAIVAFFLGEAINAIVILAIVILNGLLGFFQEYKAEKALIELKKFVS